MISRHNLTPLFSLLRIAVLLPVFGGCNSDSQDQRSREEKTRDEVAKATERTKPVIEKARREIDDAAHVPLARRVPQPKVLAKGGRGTRVRRWT